MRISLIVAMAKNRVIGSKNKMPWHLPADFAYFKKMTTGHPVIMGRKTFESIGHPLPGRRNIVISRNATMHADGVEIMASLEQAFDACLRSAANLEAYVIGGATIYMDALPRADRILITEVDASPDGDIFFPVLDAKQWAEVSRVHRVADEKNIYAMDFVVLERIR
ncbi:MAG: dihydrofolate reductase [Burkholderiales bacterium]|nr:dihydrofolate reductase [Burkholderiales bacterium]